MSAHTLIGREGEISDLESALARAAAGAPQIVLLSGEAGIGKTRLVLDFLRRARAERGGRPRATAIAGACVPVAGEGLPYAPILQGLRELFRTLPDAERRHLVGRWPSELVRFVPSESVPGQPAADPAEVGSVATVTAVSTALDSPTSSSAQVRLFESLLMLLARLGRRGPVVLVAEDLHWADRSSLDLLAFLAHNLRTEPVLLLATYRDDEPARDAPLRSWLAEMARLPSASRMTLERLDLIDTARQIGALTGRPVDPDVAEQVHLRSAGNPLFTEHLLRDGAPLESTVVPATLRELIEARIAGLPALTRRVLGVMAVVGRPAAVELLATVVEQDEIEVEDSLRPAIERQVLEARPDETYRFRHPAFRDVVNADLLPGERRRWHARVATQLCRERPTGPVDRAVITGSIARHWQVAGDPVRAFSAAVDAGAAATDVYAFAEADEHLRRAVELLPQVHDDALVEAGLPIPDRVEVLAEAAQAAHLIGDGERAAKLINLALQRVSDPLRRAALYERLGSICFLAGRAASAEEAYQAALELVPAEPASALRARVVAGVGMLAMAWTRLDEARVACLDAIELAEATGARRELGTALNALGVVRAYGGEFEQGIDDLQSSLAIAKELDDPDQLAPAYIHLGHVLGVAARFDEAVEVCLEGYEAMRRVGLQRQDGSFLQGNAAECLINAGRWDEAAWLLDEAQAQRARGLRGFPVLRQAARLATGRGRLDAAAETLEQIHALLDGSGAPDSWRREMLEAVAELALWRRNPQAALDAALDGLEMVERGDEQRFAAPLVTLALRALADQAEDARAAQNPDRLEVALGAGKALVNRAALLDPDPLDEGAGVLPESAAQAAQYRAELARLEGDPDSASWAVAAERWTSAGRPYPAAYCRLREAEALLAHRQSGAAPIAALRAAHGTATALGATGLIDEATALARWHRIDLRSQAAGTPVDRSQEATGDQLGLTARELEILGELAAGKTNREIAESLFISVKTASVHVSNILRKLDVPGRGEAARVAHRLGILA